MELSRINSQIAQAVGQAQGVNGVAGIGGAKATGAGLDFAASLDSALKSVSQNQAQAQELQRQFQMENPDVSLEQTMVAMNTAQLSFSAAVQVRNRLAQAYDTIMNMQV